MAEVAMAKIQCNALSTAIIKPSKPKSCSFQKVALKEQISLNMQLLIESNIYFFCFQPTGLPKIELCLSCLTNTKRRRLTQTMLGFQPDTLYFIFFRSAFSPTAQVDEPLKLYDVSLTLTIDRCGIRPISGFLFEGLHVAGPQSAQQKDTKFRSAFHPFAS